MEPACDVVDAPGSPDGAQVRGPTPPQPATPPLQRRMRALSWALLQLLLLAAGELLRCPSVMSGRLAASGPSTCSTSPVWPLLAWKCSAAPGFVVPSHPPLVWAVLLATTLVARCASGQAIVGGSEHALVSRLERHVDGLSAHVARLVSEQQQRPPATAAAGGGASELLLQELEVRLELAVAMQQLATVRLADGRRLDLEAEQQYRAALALLDIAEADGVPLLLSGPTPDAGKTPLRPRALLSLGALLWEHDRPAEALALLEEGLGLVEGAPGQRGGLQEGDKARTPQPPAVASLLCGLCFNRAKALSSLGRLQEAQQAYERAAGGAHGLDAQCWAQSLAAMEALPDGLLEQVLGTVREAQDAGLHQPGGRGGSDHAAAAAAGWLGALGARELSWLEFAAFKALDARGRHGEAWGHLDRANTLVAPLYGYAPAHDVENARKIMALLRQPLLSSLASEQEQAAQRQQQQQLAATPAPGVAEPVTSIFIVGLPRSGSTLLETMLSVHPAGVWAAGERSAMTALSNEVNDRLRETGTWPQDLRAMGRRYIDAMTQRARATGWPADKPLRVVVDKMLMNLQLVGYIELMLPGACIVNVQRHPLDVALSCYSQPFVYSATAWSWDLAHIAQTIKTASAFAKHWAEQLPGRVLTLRYEEIVASPEASMRHVLAHCGLPWDQGVLDFHTANRTVSTASMAQVRKPLYSGSVFRWQRYAAQLAPVGAALREEVESYERELAQQLAQLTTDEGTGGRGGVEGQAAAGGPQQVTLPGGSDATADGVHAASHNEL